MVALKFASSHNMVAFLDKPTESDGFEQIVDFLNARPIKYVLTVNPTIYIACIEQFWATAKVKTVNGEVQIQALVDKKKSRRKQRKDIEVSQPSDPTEPMADETKNVESVPTDSNDLLLSGKDRLKLNELMKLCTSLSQRVIALETTKTNQALEIDSLKRRVKKLKKKKGSRTHRLRRLFRGREIVDLDADAEVTLVDEAQERNDDYYLQQTKKVYGTTFTKHIKKVKKLEKTVKTLDKLKGGQNLKFILLKEVSTAEPALLLCVASVSTTGCSVSFKDKGVLTQMLVSKLLVKQDSEMSRELLRKIFMPSKDTPQQRPEVNSEKRGKRLYARDGSVFMYDI
ncbi:hypothetical protein Tco_0965962 [Tanacetum coccineum]